MGLKKRVTRFSGADWAEELREISLIGVGGIGSWLALNLSRIGHRLYIYDGDIVDQTNVNGGQMYKQDQIGINKALNCYSNCRAFGAIDGIQPIDTMFDEECFAEAICMTGLDNMAARKLSFGSWTNNHSEDPEALFMDGRLLMESMEILTIQGGNRSQIEKYRREFLFDDSEVPELDCTTKQSTFSAMIIAGLMTATLCNFLTNRTLGMEVREVPFHQKPFLPIFKHESYVLPNTPETTEYIVEPVEVEPLKV